MKSMRLGVLALLLLASSARAGDAIFLAVGGGGRVMTSPDAQTWTVAQEWADNWADDSNLLHSAAHGLGKIVAVGGGGWSRAEQAGHILVSSDGKTWREAAKFPNRIIPVLFHGERFVAAGSQGLLWSADGEKWNAGVAPAQLEERRAAEGTVLKGFNERRGAAGNGLFLIVGDASGPAGKITFGLTTRDGTQIVDYSTKLPPVSGVTFGVGKFILSGKDGIFSSLDGIAWTREKAAPSAEPGRIEWSGKEFIVADKKGLHRSPDGVRWESFGKKPPGWIAAASPLGFVAMNWGANLFFSPDGAEWKRITQPDAARQMERVIFVSP